MPQLILIRHSVSQADPTVPASEWRLSEKGRRLCEPLAAALRSWRPERLISSVEPKAIETAQLTAAHLDIPSAIATGLHEHDRSNVPYLNSQDAFDERVIEMFTRPDEVVFGRESAHQARDRFSEALERAADQFAAESVGIVSHGTVMCLFAAPLIDQPPLQLWKRLGMPAFIVLTRPDNKLLEMVESISLLPGQAVP